MKIREAIGAVMVFLLACFIVFLFSIAAISAGENYKTFRIGEKMQASFFSCLDPNQALNIAKLYVYKGDDEALAQAQSLVEQGSCGRLEDTPVFFTRQLFVKEVDDSVISVYEGVVEGVYVYAVLYGWRHDTPI